MFEAPASITLNRPPAGSAGASQLLIESTGRLAALSRAVECLAMDLCESRSACSLALGLTNAVALHHPAIRPRCRRQRPHRHPSRPRRLCRRCPRLHRPRPHPPTLLPALVAAAYASHVTLCSTTLHSPIVLARGSHSPRSKKSELRSLLSHQPEAVNPRVPAGPFTTKTSTPAIHI